MSCSGVHYVTFNRPDGTCGGTYAVEHYEDTTSPHKDYSENVPKNNNNDTKMYMSALSYDKNKQVAYR